MTTAARATWTPTEPELRSLVRAAVWTVYRRDVVILACVCIGTGILVLPLGGPADAALSAGIPFAVLAVVFLLVTHRRNARLIRAAYPVGRETAAEARPTGLLIENAVQATELPWGRLVDPAVRGPVVRVRDTVVRRRVVLPRQLCPDSFVARLAGAADHA